MPTYEERSRVSVVAVKMASSEHLRGFISPDNSFISTLFSISTDDEDDMPRQSLHARSIDISSETDVSSGTSVFSGKTDIVSVTDIVSESDDVSETQTIRVDSKQTVVLKTFEDDHAAAKNKSLRFIPKRHARRVKERLEKRRLEKERLEKQKLKERLEKDRLEEKIEQERLEKDRLEKERIEKERLEKEKIEKERLDKETLEQEKVQRERRQSIYEAHEFLQEFVQARWPTIVSNGHVKIHCDLGMDQLRAIGHLGRVDGGRECQKLITAPVIHDDISRALWEELSTHAASEHVNTEVGKEPKEAEDRETKDRSGIAIKEAPCLHAVAKENESRKRRKQLVCCIDGDCHQRTTRCTRRQTEGDISSVLRSNFVVRTSERPRRKSDRALVRPALVRPDQVLCTTCGSRAMGSLESEEVMSDEDEEISMERISKMISFKMGKKLKELGGDMASGYGGSRMTP